MTAFLYRLQRHSQILGPLLVVGIAPSLSQIHRSNGVLQTAFFIGIDLSSALLRCFRPTEIPALIEEACPNGMRKVGHLG